MFEQGKPQHEQSQLTAGTDSCTGVFSIRINCDCAFKLATAELHLQLQPVIQNRTVFACPNRKVRDWRYVFDNANPEPLFQRGLLPYSTCKNERRKRLSQIHLISTALVRIVCTMSFLDTESSRPMVSAVGNQNESLVLLDHQLFGLISQAPS